MHDVDHSSYELGAVRLTLRRDLAFRQQSYGAHACYVIEDPTKHGFFRIGVAEYTFISLLDGHTSVAEAVAATATRIGSDAFTETQAAALCRWLIDNSLASTPQSQAASRLIENAQAAAAAKKRQWLNPIMLKVPLGNPDRLIRWLTPMTSWFFGQFGFAIWLMTILLGSYTVAVHRDELAASPFVISPQNWLWLGLAWLALKFIHEAAHGIACRRFNGETREAGVLMLLLVPLPWIDVTSSWRFGSKWQRIIVAAAGMYAELFVAALAATVAIQSGSEIVQYHAVNIMFTAGIVTLLFNVNPLMRFDGYYILSDLLELPNLATHGQQDLMYLCRRWLLGTKVDRPVWPEGRGAVVRAYGLAAFAWRLLICVSLIMAAGLLFHGAGIVLAVLGIVMWAVMPLLNFCRYMVIGDPINPPGRMRFAAIMSSCAAVGFGVWNYVPYVERLQLPAVVEFDPAVSMRAGMSGFVRETHVVAGQQVEAGQLLFRLENDQLATRIEDAQLAIEQSRLDATRYHRSGNMAAFQVEVENETALQARLNELQSQADQLTITASIAGTVVSRGLNHLQDRWISAGTELLLIGNQSDRSIHFMVPQTHIAQVRQMVMNSDAEKSVRVHIWGNGNHRLSGEIADVAPRGSTSLRFPSLAAPAGGPLAVRPMSSTSPQPANNSSEWQLLEPHFVGRVKLQQAAIDSLGSGQTGLVEFTATRGTIGQVARSKIAAFFQRRKVRN